ncbi:MAG TPA: outer membrane protein assembly factor BamE [Ramlibacter sp.]|jgi:outer membrane protein assembly factor BamE (lipoprotein component of BamABCDE complex)
MAGPLRVAWAAVAAALFALGGCDQQRIDQLEEGVATEADVRRQFGQPHASWPESDGGTTFEYSRQPEGQVAYMITIGPDGRMSALRQVLRPSEFSRIVPGMDAQQVRRLLGRPATTARYALRPGEEHWQWRWLDGQAPRVFTVTFDRAGRVAATATGEDPRETYKPA